MPLSTAFPDRGSNRSERPRMLEFAPALRVGFVVADWNVLSRMLPLKTDAGSGSIEQMVLAEYCAPHFATHLPVLRKALRKKVETLMEALNEQFGTSAEFEVPKGGIFLWVKLPDEVDTLLRGTPGVRADRGLKALLHLPPKAHGTRAPAL